MSATSARLLAALLFLLATPAFGATDWYFSDCLTGGSGSIGDPYCLDPGNDGTNDSFEFLVNGAGNEVAAGDTIWLCCGGTDGCGDATTSCTYPLEGHTCPGEQSSPLCVINLDISGNSGAWITVDEFAGDTGVVLSGDSNQDGTYDVGTDTAYFLINRQVDEQALNGFGFWQFKNITIEKVARRSFYIVRTKQKDWMFDNVTLRYLGAGNLGAGGAHDDAYFGEDAASPTTKGHYDDGAGSGVGCDYDEVNEFQENWNAFTYGSNSGSNFTFQNGSITQSCVTFIRSNGNCYDVSDNADPTGCGAGGTMNILNNTMYAITAMQNGHQGTGWTWDGNVIYDFIAGIGMEEQSHNMTITDNDISLRGTYRMSLTGRADYAMKVTDGDTIGECTDADPEASTACSTRNILIARNKVWSRGTSNNAYLWGGIVIQAHNIASDHGGVGNYIVENNIVFGQQHHNSCDIGGDEYRPMEAPIAILTNEPTILRNNTTHTNECAVHVRDGFEARFGGTGTVAHTVINNLFEQSTEATPPLLFGVNAATSTITHNLLYETSGTVATIQPSTNYSCANPIVGLGGGNTNKCVNVTYLDDSGDPNTWDLHLDAADTVCKDAGTPGATDDIDGTSRPQGGGTDIGADELPVAGGAKTAVTGKVTVSGKAGTP